MSYPDHPDTIIIKNEFYPDGLREIDIWNYYQKVKGPLLQQVINRDLMFFIMVNVNKDIVLRKGKTTRFLRLNNQNYDTLITGRTVSIHSTMKRHENFGIVDIDTDDFDEAKLAAFKVYNHMTKSYNTSIRFTGKSSFHVVCEFNREKDIDNIRNEFEQKMRDSNLSQYTIGYRRTGRVPNLDLSSNKLRGGFITLHSLSTIGLRCMEIDSTKIIRFRKELAKI
jgi:hypothetical protein